MGSIHSFPLGLVKSPKVPKVLDECQPPELQRNVLKFSKAHRELKLSNEKVKVKVSQFKSNSFLSTRSKKCYLINTKLFFC